MYMYIVFGDYFNDGHGRYKKVLVDAPNKEYVKIAYEKILEKYGKNFFNAYAQDYGEPCLSELNWQALIDSNYPISRLIECEIDNDYENMTSIEEMLINFPNPYVNLDFVIDSFIWLLNFFGANIRMIEEPPTVTFIEMVGYGCFY